VREKKRKGAKKEIERERDRERERENKKAREKRARTHTHTNTHTSKRAHDRTHTLISWCPLEIGEVKGHAFIFIGLRCLEIFHLFLYARHTPKPPSALFSCPTPTLHFLIPPLPLLSLFLSSCLALDL